MMEERGLPMAHTTIMRWVHQYGPNLDERVRLHLKPTNDSWRVDEKYIKVKGQWMYLYRAVDSEGITIDFYLSESRDKQAAKRFFKKALATSHVCKPRVIIVDKNPAYLVAIQELKEEKHMPEGIQISSFDVRIKNISYSYLHIEWYRSEAMIKKKQVHQGEKSAQNQKNSSIDNLD